MDALQQFWANWWVQLAVAIGTIGAVVVALFGDAFRAKFFPPKLSIRLLSTSGEKTQVTLSWVENGQQLDRREEARYYHLHVTNARRWSPAHQTQIVLLAVEEPDASGRSEVVWSGDVPLRWRHQEVFPTLRTVGPDTCADLCSVVRGKWLQLQTLIAPHNLDVVRRSPTTMIVSIQARSNEADSNIARLKIAWDGKWHDGAQEMQKHLVVTEVSDSVA